MTQTTNEKQKQTRKITREGTNHWRDKFKTKPNIMTKLK